MKQEGNTQPEEEPKPGEHREEPKPSEHDEIHNEDFQFVLKALLEAYQPILEEELHRTQHPEELKKEAESKPPSCEDELALANRIFEKFFTEEVALRTLPPEGRQQLGPIENWRWCLLHIRCCIIFGWLVCRGPRTFRAFTYYLYRYWICVRQALGTPVGDTLTEEERQDFQTLVQALAGAYKPYLTDQLTSVEFPLGIADEVLSGEIDCFEGKDETDAIFERFLTTDTAPALLGKEAFATHSQESFFWFCRCWCLCAIRFGCCLAQARSFIDVLFCLLFYFRCIRDCFRPLRCELTGPIGCAEEKPSQNTGGLALAITGTAAGAFFSHYTLEWRRVGITPFSTSNITLTAGGTIPVVNGVLGYLNTTFLPAALYEIRLTVYSTLGGTPVVCTIQFTLFKVLVLIERVADLPGAPVQAPPGPFNSSAPIVNQNPGGIVVPVGGCISVKGLAWVGECENRLVRCIDLRYALDWQPGPNDPGFATSLPLYTNSMLVAPICYDDPDPTVEAEKRAPWNQLNTIGSLLTSRWVTHVIDLGGGITITVMKLERFCFDSASLLPLNVTTSGCPDTHHRCRSGKYTLLLKVEDTAGNVYYDTQQVWFDNKPMVSDIHVVFGGLEGLPGCSDMSLKGFVPPGAPCNTAWPINLLGIAFDEYIDETDPTYPSDNFDYYSLSITRQGGPTLTVPITPNLVSFGPDPFKGTQRVGDPGTRCEPVPTVAGCPPAPLIPPRSSGLLTKLDLRVFDRNCASSLVAPYSVPSGFPLERGTCCGYTFQLYAQDKTWSDGFAGGYHRAYSSPWAVCICNDLAHDDK